VKIKAFAGVRGLFLGIQAVLLVWLLTSAKVEAQAPPPTNQEPQGYKAVWSCPEPCTITGSTAVIDASAFCTGSCPAQNTDFCAVLNSALSALPKPDGTHLQGVVDARGVVPGTTLPMACASDPFQSLINTGNVGNITVLLPALTINLQAPWILPSNVRIVGEGSLTVLAVDPTTFTTDGTKSMLEMGASAGSTGVVVEHLRVNAANPVIGGTLGLHGIYNANAQDASYVDDVVLVAGAALNQTTTTTGLWVGPEAANSGPYSNILFQAAAHCADSCTNHGTCACSATACVKIMAPTRGLHGITCTANSVTPGNQPTIPAAAIYLDASNNTIEDVHVEGFYDAVVVGDNADGENVTVAGNTLVNILSGDGTGPVQNAVHICNPGATYGAPNYSACTSNSGITIEDLSILGAQNIGIAGSFTANTIQDDLTGAKINPSQFPTFVAKYVLGEAFLDGNTAIGYTRFTTALDGVNGTKPTVPTWTVGGNATNSPCPAPGALYSNTNGSGTAPNLNTVYVCTSALVWKAIL
jgi:hypothetical protein